MQTRSMNTIKMFIFSVGMAFMLTACSEDRSTVKTPIPPLPQNKLAQ
jgi:hypothetical protein